MPAFVGVLVALGLFLLTYRGFGNKDGRKDRADYTIKAAIRKLIGR